MNGMNVRIKNNYDKRYIYSNNKSEMDYSYPNDDVNNDLTE